MEEWKNGGMEENPVKIEIFYLGIKKRLTTGKPFYLIFRLKNYSMTMRFVITSPSVVSIWRKYKPITYLETSTWILVPFMV